MNLTVIIISRIFCKSDKNLTLLAYCTAVRMWKCESKATAQIGGPTTDNKNAPFTWWTVDSLISTDVLRQTSRHQPARHASTTVDRAAAPSDHTSRQTAHCSTRTWQTSSDRTNSSSSSSSTQLSSTPPTYHARPWIKHSPVRSQSAIPLPILLLNAQVSCPHILPQHTAVVVSGHRHYADPRLTAVHLHTMAAFFFEVWLSLTSPGSFLVVF